MTNPNKQNVLRLSVAAFFVTTTFVVGVVLRMGAIEPAIEPLWVDELHTAWCVSDSFAEVAPRAIAGHQSPLFFWLEYIAYHGLGQNEVALRLPSLVMSLCLLVSIPWIVFRLSGSFIGALMAMFLAAIDDNFLYYAIEARPYAAVQLAAVWQVYFFIVCLIRRDEAAGDTKLAPEMIRCGLMVVLPTITLFHLHFTTIALIATEVYIVTALVVWHMFRRAKSKGPIPGNYLLLFAGFGVALAMSLQGIKLLHSVGANKTDWSVMVSANRYGLMMVAHAIVYLLPVLLVAFSFRNQRVDDESKLLLLTLATLVFLPIGFAFFGSLSQLAPLGSYRFSIASSTVLIVFAGVAFRLVNTRPRKASVLGATCLLAIITSPLFEWAARNRQFPPQRWENWQVALQLIKAQSGPVVLCSNLVEDGRQESLQGYLSFPLDGIYRVPNQVIPAAMRHRDLGLTKEQLARLQSREAFWLLVRARPNDARNVTDDLRQALVDSSGNRWSFVRKKELGTGTLNLFRFTNDRL